MARLTKPKIHNIKLTMSYARRRDEEMIFKVALFSSILGEELHEFEYDNGEEDSCDKILKFFGRFELNLEFSGPSVTYEFHDNDGTLLFDGGGNFDEIVIKKVINEDP